MKSMTRPLASTGTAKMSRTLVTSTVHTKIGRRSMVRPGARSLKIVARMLIAPRIELTPLSSRPASQKSWPMPAYFASESGVYEVQPPAAAPPSPKLLKSSSAETGMIQKESALMRGKAMSAAPIWSGTM